MRRLRSPRRPSGSTSGGRSWSATASRRCSFIADLTGFAPAAALAAEVVERFGRVDVLVNNAGIAQVGEESELLQFIDMTEEQWDRDIAVNLKTAVATTRAVLPGMVERGYGRVVNVSSVTGPVVSYPGNSGYSAGKGAMDGLTRALAIETGPHGVTVNSVAPGWIATGSSSPEEIEGGREHAGRQARNAGRGGRAGGIPRVGRCSVHHRAVDRRGRRQHHPGVQRRLGSARRQSAPARPKPPTAQGSEPDTAGVGLSARNRHRSLLVTPVANWMVEPKRARRPIIGVKHRLGLRAQGRCTVRTGRDTGMTAASAAMGGVVGTAPRDLPRCRGNQTGRACARPAWLRSIGSGTRCGRGSGRTVKAPP